MKLISFSESKIVAMNITHDVIAEKIEEVTGIEESFAFCRTQKELFSALKDGFENADVILLAVDVSRFVSTKAAIFRALGFKCKLNEKITDLINSDACMATLNENQVRAHAAIPVGGKAFITNDGLFSGFGIKAGKQKLVMVPIDERRIGAVLENGLLSFITEDFEKIEKKEEAKPVSDIPESMEGYVEQIEDFETPVQSDIQPQYEEIYRAPEAAEENFEDVNSSSYEEAAAPKEEETVSDEYEDEDDTTFKNLSLIASRGVKIAFARMKDNAPYASLLRTLEKSSAVEFVDFMTDTSLTDDEKRKANAASNAKKAMKQTNADFAVSVSAVYRDEEGTGYVFATLTDVQKSSVFKIFASEGETDGDLYRAGLESIIEKIEEMSAEMKANAFSDGNADEANTVSEKKDISFATKVIIWLLIVVALCTLSALIIDAVMSGSASLGQSANAIIENTGNLFLR